MSKYIKIDDLQEFCDNQIAHEITPNDFQRMNHLEIVRCKDCAYAIYKEGLVQHGHIVCTKPFTERWQVVKPDNWFCADGEPKRGG